MVEPCDDHGRCRGVDAHGERGRGGDHPQSGVGPPKLFLNNAPLLRLKIGVVESD
jgi:hypothetical protein